MPSIRIIRGAKDENSFFVESNYGLMLFDNGAATSQILRSDRTDSLEKAKARESHGAFGSKKQDVVLVPQLTIGDIYAENLLVAVDDSIGLLGNDVLRRYAYTFDTSGNEITLIDPFCNGIRCTIGQKGHIYIPIQIAGINCMALMDTGASCSLIDSTFCARYHIGVEGKTDTGEDWTGATFETQSAMIDSLVIGDERFPKHEFALLNFRQEFPYMEYPVAAIIGASTLLHKKFHVNQIDGYLRLESSINRQTTH